MTDLTSPNCWNLRLTSLSSIVWTESLSVTIRLPWNCWIKISRHSRNEHDIVTNLIFVTIATLLLVIAWKRIMNIDLKERKLYWWSSQWGASKLTGLPLISEPCRRSLARSAARISNWIEALVMVDSVLSETHEGHENHSPCCNEIEKGFDISMLFEWTTDVLTIRLILQK